MEKILSMFSYQGTPCSCEPYGSGHINTTYKVECKKGERTFRYILQQINSDIFSDTDALMENTEKVTNFLKEKISRRGGDVLRETLNLVPTTTGRNYYTDKNGANWRSFVFIENAVCLDKIESPKLFYSCGYAFGKFQNLLADFPAEDLHEVIPNFHNTPLRYEAFKMAVEADRRERAKGVQREIAFIEERAGDMSLLTDMLKKGQLPLRVTHNDTKLNNCMFDKNTGEAICVIDLDTVMPGLRAYDFGDSIRFGATTGAEDEPDLTRINFSLPLFDSYTEGFFASCGQSMTEQEAFSLPIGAKLMTLECGMRFLTDYLEGDTYFKTCRENQNLDRCRTQFKLVLGMEGQWGKMNGKVMSEFERYVK